MMFTSWVKEDSTCQSASTLFILIQKGIMKPSQRDVIVEKILNSFLSIWSESKPLASWITLSTDDVTIKWPVSSSQMPTDCTSVNNDLQVRTFETLRVHPMWIFIKTFLDWISFGFSIFRLIWGKYQETGHKTVQVLGALQVLLWEGFSSISLSISLSLSLSLSHTHIRDTVLYNSYTWKGDLYHICLVSAQPDTCELLLLLATSSSDSTLGSSQV